MINIGRICVKIAGRDAGKRCLIVDILDNNRVLIDGETRRRPCNMLHLEPLEETVKIKKGASHEEVVQALKEFKFNIQTTTPKKAKEKPKKIRKAKSPEEKAAQKKAKEEKKKKAKKTVVKQEETVPEKKETEQTESSS